MKKSKSSGDDGAVAAGMNHEVLNEAEEPVSLHPPSTRFVRTIGRRSLLKALGPAGATVASAMGVVPTLLADRRINPAVRVNGLVFPDLASFNGDQLRQANFIMPEPCKFISAGLPACSVIRPGTTERSGAVAAATAVANSGLLSGQSGSFFFTLQGLAMAADNARRTGVD